MLMRFDPFSDFDRLTRQVWGNTRTNYMPADAYRQGDRFYLHLALPGIDPESIDVTVEKNTLTVSAERKWERDGEEQVLLNERPVGSFSRQFFLVEGLDTDAIEAGYDHGVLTLAIPIAETAKARKISVNTTHEALTA
ncbi:MAG TPA: Hsp20/alpha crystallin family protein [Acidimicrobiia bacterium]|nr:Hsp20/alpha crystallin family protein [Acidimicrobiia bacterium]